MPWSAGRVTTVPSRVTIQALDEEPSVTQPSASTNQASRAPCSRAACLASTLGSSDTDLMSTRAQRFSGTVMTAMPSAAPPARSWRDRALRAVTTMLGARAGAAERHGRAAPRRGVTCR